MTIIWHNPRCSKSRATLKLLQDRGINTEIRDYLNDPPNRSEIMAVLAALGMQPAELVRTGERACRIAGINRDSRPRDLIDAMVSHPVLIERPVVIKGDRARIGRPPERVLELFA